MAQDTRYPKPPIWLLVDGNNQVVTDAHGVGVMGAAAAFARRLKLLIDWWEPSCVIACFDHEISWRRELLREYKSGRQRLPGIENAIIAAQGELRDMGVGVMSVEGFEADDLLATLAGEAQRSGARAVLYSRDKDLHQCLVDGEVCQLLRATKVRHSNGRSGRMELQWRNVKDLLVEYQITPDQWVDYQCLVGQPSDNIKGVSGVGDRTAQLVLKNCGSIEGFFENPWRAGISTRLIAAISNSKRWLFQYARPLCTLRRNVPLPELWREAC